MNVSKSCLEETLHLQHETINNTNSSTIPTNIDDVPMSQLQMNSTTPIQVSTMSHSSKTQLNGDDVSSPPNIVITTIPNTLSPSSIIPLYHNATVNLY